MIPLSAWFLPLPKQLFSTNARQTSVLPVPGPPLTTTPLLVARSEDSWCCISLYSQSRPIKGEEERELWGTSKYSGLMFRNVWLAWCPWSIFYSSCICLLMILPAAYLGWHSSWLETECPWAVLAVDWICLKLCRSSTLALDASFLLLGNVWLISSRPAEE